MRDHQSQVDLGGRAQVLPIDLLVEDRALTANAALLVERWNEHTHAPSPNSSESSPLYQGREKGPVLNIALRLGGLALIGISVAAVYWLLGLIQADGRHPATLFEYLLALFGFAGASAGSVLLILGTHIFDEVEVSERWRSRR